MKKRSENFDNHVRTVCALAFMAFVLSGCAGMNVWGQKSSSTPGTVGGSMSIPLGKK